mgnify:CR=1 FL=1
MDQFHRNYKNFFRGATPSGNNLNTRKAFSNVQNPGYLSVKNSGDINQGIQIGNVEEYQKNLNLFFGTHPEKKSVGGFSPLINTTSLNQIEKKQTNPTPQYQVSAGGVDQMKEPKAYSIDPSLQMFAGLQAQAKSTVPMYSEKSQDPVIQKYNAQYDQMQKHFELQKQQFLQHQLQNQNLSQR